MNKVFTYLAIASLALVACQKEATLVENQNKQDAVQSNIPTEIICEVSETPTKTQYAGNTSFGWTSGDQIKMPVVKRTSGTITACYFFTFTTSSASGSVSATFILNGSAGDDLENYDPNPGGSDNTWTNMGYLVYPQSIFNKEHSENYPVVNLPTSYTYSSTKPLDGGVVPMIGRKVGDTYKFSTAVGFIKVTINSMPAETAKVVLESSANNIAGKFAVSDVTADIAQILNTSAVTASGTITLNVASVTAGNNYDFYFPVPVGTYAADVLTIKVLDSSSNVLASKTAKKELTVSRNEVLSLPAITTPFYNVSVYGSSATPVGKFIKRDAVIFFTVSDSQTTLDRNSYIDGMKFSYAGTDTYDQLSTKAFLSSATGKKYLHYTVAPNKYGESKYKCKDVAAGDIIAQGYVPFYYLASSDITGTYSYTGTVVWQAADATESWTFASSDDCTRGNVMITSTSIWSLSGNIYGEYNGSSITFDGTKTIFSSNTYNCIVGNWATDEQGSAAIITNIVFTVSSSTTLTTSKIGIGYNYAGLSEPITSAFLSTRYFPNETTWTK